MITNEKLFGKSARRSFNEYAHSMFLFNFEACVKRCLLYPHLTKYPVCRLSFPGEHERENSFKAYV